MTDAAAERRRSLVAGVFLFDGDGRVLLVRENYGRGRYGPPGGFVEPGESPQAAAVREALEETGVRVELDGLVGTIFHASDDGDFVGFAFAGRIVAGTPTVADVHEIAELGWFDPLAPPTPLTPLARFLADASAGLRGVARP